MKVFSLPRLPRLPLPHLLLPRLSLPRLLPLPLPLPPLPPLLLPLDSSLINVNLMSFLTFELSAVSNVIPHPNPHSPPLDLLPYPCSSSPCSHTTTSRAIRTSFFGILDTHRETFIAYMLLIFLCYTILHQRPLPSRSSHHHARLGHLHTSVRFIRPVTCGAISTLQLGDGGVV